MNANKPTVEDNTAATGDVNNPFTVDSKRASTWISKHGLDPLAWQWFRLYFDSDFCDLPKEAMQAFQIVSEDFVPTTTWVDRVIFHPVRDQIWKKLRKHEQYCMTPSEIQILMYLKQKAPDKEMDCANAAVERSYVQLLQGISKSCRTNAHHRINSTQCNCWWAQQFLRDETK